MVILLTMIMVVLAMMIMILVVMMMVVRLLLRGSPTLRRPLWKIMYHKLWFLKIKTARL